jgi:transposase
MPIPNIPLEKGWELAESLHLHDWDFIVAGDGSGTTWEYDRELYKGRNVVERNFRKIKQFRRVFTRHDKLDET